MRAILLQLVDDHPRHTQKPRKSKYPRVSKDGKISKLIADKNFS
jgi:hypothetical protein